MATQTLKFRKIVSKNPYPKLLRAYQRDAKKLPEREAAFTRVRARSIMKKAPKKPKSRFGNYRMYKEEVYMRRRRRLMEQGKAGAFSPGYWRKGLHSRPGHPPYWHTPGFNLRTIVFGPIVSRRPQSMNVNARPQEIFAWRVGPKHDNAKGSGVPGLQEYGGSLRLQYRRGQPVYQQRGLKQRHIKTRPGQKLMYPARPYMRPAAKEARESAARKSPHSLKKITKLGGMKGRRIY